MNDLFWLTLNSTKYNLNFTDPTPDPLPDEDDIPEPDSEPDDSLR